MGHDIRIDRSKLHPWLNYKLTLLLNQCEKKGIYLIITQGFRSKAEQDSLYAQGRTKPGNIVTNAKGNDYSSQHQWGIAFDIAINDK
ncbi:MAG: M15 family metallopeptidase, partial [Eubacterium sp.]|nr:M15 family metallopeptidase [Eubacterium sp.]